MPTLQVANMFLPKTVSAAYIPIPPNGILGLLTTRIP